MTKEQMDGEVDYRVSLFVLNELLEKGHITRVEFDKMKVRLLQKYTPVISSLGD
jgi:hypothetical protein